MSLFHLLFYMFTIKPFYMYDPRLIIMVPHVKSATILSYSMVPVWGGGRKGNIMFLSFYSPTVEHSIIIILIRCLCFCVEFIISLFPIINI